MPEPSHHAPIGGKPRVVVTRRAEQAAVLVDKLQAAGFQPLSFPTIELQAMPAPELDRALTQIERFDWLLFSSANAVHFFFRRLMELNMSPRLPRTAAIGPATARRLAEHDIQPDFMPDTFTGAALATGLGDVCDKKILLPRARIGGPQIVEKLRSRGAFVSDIPLYDTVTAVPDRTALAKLSLGYEAITFASPSSVHGFLEISGKPIGAAVVACIGPVTAEAADEYGLPIAVMPDEYTLDSLVQALTLYFGERRHE